jgi:hypothetical protein
MARVPVSKTGIHEFKALLNEAHRLLSEARETNSEVARGKLAETENKLNTIQSMVCPIMVCR